MSSSSCPQTSPPGNPPASPSYERHGFSIGYNSTAELRDKLSGLGKRLAQAEAEERKEEKPDQNGIAHLLRLAYWKGSVEALKANIAATRRIQLHHKHHKARIHFMHGKSNEGVTMHGHGTIAGGGRARPPVSRQMMQAFGLHGRMTPRNQARYFPEGVGAESNGP